MHMFINSASHRFGYAQLAKFSSKLKYLFPSIIFNFHISQCMITRLRTSPITRFTRIITRSFAASPSRSSLDVLYEMSQQTKTPFFAIQSHLIEIIDDPLDFYLSIYNESQKAINRIGISSLYLGTGTLQRFLFKRIAKRVQTVSTLHVSMVYDYNRSLRKEKGESSIQMMNQYMNSEIAKRLKISLNKQSSNRLSLLGEVSGVHHQKVAVFDDTVIIGGANLSHNYFINRKDRYIKFKHCPQLADYLYDYVHVLQQNSYGVGIGPVENKRANLQNHYKLWKFSYSPEEYRSSIAQQEAELLRIQTQKQKEAARIVDGEIKKQISKNRNVILSEALGSDISPLVRVSQAEVQARRENVRSKLLSVGDQNDVGNHLMEMQNLNTEDQDLTEVGEKVYIFPFIQYPSLGEKLEPQVFCKILSNAIASRFTVRLSSGYLNLTKQILNVLQNSEIPTQILCSAPQANSFYRGGVFKKYIPYFYRNFEGMMLRRWPGKFKIKEYFDGKWSFHAKGAWIKQDDNNYLTVVGSSNFNRRSKERDTQLQLYLFSTCPNLNVRLDHEWDTIAKDCKEITFQEIQQDKQIKFSRFWNALSSMFSRFL